MKSLISVLFLTISAIAADTITPFFSPKGGCTESVVAEINKAKKTLHIQAYSFTSAPIAKAVSDAKARNVEVMVLLDKGVELTKYSVTTYLKNQGVSFLIDDKHPIAHNKIVIVDGITLLTGSFNFTKQAESNAENLLVITGNAPLIKTYEDNFQRHLVHCRAAHP